MFPTHPKFRKLQLRQQDDVPTRTEIRSYLGSSLTEVFSDYSHETTRELLGVIPPLNGPPEELWKSPSDQLIGKVALKPPLTNKCVKACTHQGILEIGEVAAQRYAAETEEKIRERLRDELIENRKMFEAEKRRDIELSVGKVTREYEESIQILNEDFARKLEIALNEAEKKSSKEMQKAVERERMAITLEMMKKLREEIGHVVVSLNDEFEQSIRAQRDNMVADFNAIMRRERGKVDDKMKSFEQKNAEEMHSQRRELEMQNMADAAYILCTERMRCSSEKHAMHQCFEKQIEALQKHFAESTKTAPLLCEDEKVRESSEDKNVEYRDFFQVVEIIDKEGKKWRPIQLNPEIPQLECTEEEKLMNIPIVSSEINYFPPDEYTDKIISDEPSAKSLHSYDSLPFCYFEDKLYVRSDYREEDNNKCAEVLQEKKTMVELSEGARFIIELKSAPNQNCQNRQSRKHSNKTTK